MTEAMKEPMSDGLSETDRQQTERSIWKALAHIIDPELHLNIVDLGLIYEVEVDEDGKAAVLMTLTTPGCPVGSVLRQAVGKVAGAIPGVREVRVELTFEPRWTPHRITQEGRRQLARR